MKPISSMALFMLLSSSLLMTTHAGTVTTTTTTTVTTVKKTSCHAKHKKHKKHYCNNCRYSYVIYEDYSWNNGCPDGNGYNCYYDLQGNHFQQDYLPVDYGHQVQFRCLDNDDPASCS